MSQLSDQYEKETGASCCMLMCNVYVPTSKYANWLEDKVEKLTAHNSQSDAIAAVIAEFDAIPDGAAFPTRLGDAINKLRQQHT